MAGKKFMVEMFSTGILFQGSPRRECRIGTAKALVKVPYLKSQVIARLETEVLHTACTDNLAESF